MLTVTLSDLANIGELIAGVGVIVSLLYLAVQIRESRRIATWNAHVAISESAARVTADIAKDPDFFRVWRGVLDSPTDASDEDRERVGFVLHEVFSNFENAGRFGDPSLGDRLGSIHDKFLRAPGVQEWWARQRESYSEPFRSRIDARLVELKGTTRVAPS
jgi:hypothetical protein